MNIPAGQVKVSRMGLQQHHPQWYPALRHAVSRVTAALPTFLTAHTARGTAGNRGLLSSKKGFLPSKKGCQDFKICLHLSMWQEKHRLF